MILKKVEQCIAELKDLALQYTIISIADNCNINGNCVDAAKDELFRLTMKEGKLTVEMDTVRTETLEFSPILEFEQDPVQILDARLPLYLNSQILRALQELLAL
ncbi:ATP synthase subunit gamma chloroplastic [Bienertia sinuspersici]